MDSNKILLLKAEEVINNAIARLGKANNPHMKQLREDLLHDLNGINATEVAITNLRNENADADATLFARAFQPRT